MKIIFFFVTTLICLVGYSQVTIKKDYLIKTQWASKDNDSLFFKLDTIQLVKLNSIDSSNLATYFNGNDYITIKLNKGGKMQLSTHQVKIWSVTTRYGRYKWAFDQTKQVLSLFLNKKRFASFRPISQRQVEVPSKYSDYPPFRTNEISLKRIN